jgi:serine phosphatase RsbU (regulator of sigma subunit)
VQSTVRGPWAQAATRGGVRDNDAVDRGPSVRRVIALLLLVEVAIFVVDLAVDSIAIAATLALPVAVMALLAGPRATAGSGLLAVLLATVVGVAAGDGMDSRDAIRVGIVAGVAVVATVGATGRRRLERDVSRLELLAALGPQSVTGRPVAETAGGLLDPLVPAFADGVAVDLEGGERLALRGRAPSAEASRDGTATIVLPLRVPGREVGRVVACRLSGRGRFTRADMRFGRAAANRIALAIENARLMEELTHAEATQRHIADALQRSLRPSGLPEVPGIRLATFYRAMGEATDVGGDFYDVFPVAGGHLLVIGDVTGKGAQAASITALARGALGAAAAQSGSAVEAVARLDELLGRRDELTLCSVACVHLCADGSGMSARVVLAGHPPVLLLREGEVLPLGNPGPLPGAFVDVEWAATQIDLEPGDVIVLRTDGVTDTVGADGRLGEDRLRAALSGLPPGDVDGAVSRIRAVVDEHTVGEQRDDTAVLAAAVVDRPAAEEGASEPAAPITAERR